MRSLYCYCFNIITNLNKEVKVMEGAIVLHHYAIFLFLFKLLNIGFLSEGFYRCGELKCTSFIFAY